MPFRTYALQNCTSFPSSRCPAPVWLLPTSRCMFPLLHCMPCRYSPVCFAHRRKGAVPALRSRCGRTRRSARLCCTGTGMCGWWHRTSSPSSSHWSFRSPLLTQCSRQAALPGLLRRSSCLNSRKRMQMMRAAQSRCRTGRLSMRQAASTASAAGRYCRSGSRCSTGCWMAIAARCCSSRLRWTQKTCPSSMGL